VALALLVAGVAKGLLGYPELQIGGNGSHARLLRWYADHSGNELPPVRVLNAPLWLYRLAMLAWSLWLAFALLRWLKFGWEAFASGGYWRKIERKPRVPKAAKLPQPEPPREEGG
jgi:hypothetical protein